MYLKHVQAVEVVDIKCSLKESALLKVLLDNNVGYRVKHKLNISCVGGACQM